MRFPRIFSEKRKRHDLLIFKIDRNDSEINLNRFKPEPIRRDDMPRFMHEYTANVVQNNADRAIKNGNSRRFIENQNAARKRKSEHDESQNRGQ